ncbi:hypothetical protein AYO38_10675 [bacterium SCGC AG-212-C10]|nr:hypothetical protein AYO38_10675 [bacterium SCGC AG-212-C10]
MAKFKTLPLNAAPRASTTPNSLKRRMHEYDDYIQDVGPDEVGVLEGEGGESTFALAQRIARAGRRAGKEVTSWSADGKLYFSVDGAAAPRASASEAEAKPAPARGAKAAAAKFELGKPTSRGKKS